MKGAQQKINKIKLALSKKYGRYISVSAREFYSNKNNCFCTCYEIYESTEEKVKLTRKAKEIKRLITQLERKGKNTFEKEKELEKIEDSLERYVTGKIEMFGKKDVLLFLADVYKREKELGELYG